MKRCTEIAIVVIAALAPCLAVVDYRRERQLDDFRAEIAATSAVCRKSD
jgi:hypothetical protein